MEDITNADYTQKKRGCTDFKIEDFGEYHDFHAKNDPLLLADVLKDIHNKCLEIYGLNPVHFLSAPG